MIDAVVRIDLDALDGLDLEDQLDALLAVADDERLAMCVVCDAIVPYDESVPACEATYGAGARLCGLCHDEPDTDALMDAAIDERFGIPAREDAREREREAMPPVMDGVPF